MVRALEKENIDPDEGQIVNQLTIKELKETMRIPATQAKNLSSLRRSAASFDSIDTKTQKAMRSVLCGVLNASAAVLCPQFPRELVADFVALESKAVATSFENNCILASTFLPPRSLQRSSQQDD